MKRNITIAIAISFLLSIALIGYAQADKQVATPKPPSVSEESVVKPKAQEVETEKVKKDEEILKELEEKMEKLEAEYKASPKESEKAQGYMKQIKALQKKMRAIRAKSQKVRKEKQLRNPYQRLQEQIDRIREDIKKLEDRLVSARGQIKKEMMKPETTGESPKVTEIRRTIGQLQRKLDVDRDTLRKLLDKQRAYLNLKKRRPRPPAPPRQVAPEARRRAMLNLRLEIFPISHANAFDLSRIIKPFLTPKVGVIAPCQYPNAVIVRDTPEMLKQVAKIIKYVDVPKKKVEKGK